MSDPRHADRLHRTRRRHRTTLAAVGATVALVLGGVAAASAASAASAVPVPCTSSVASALCRPIAAPQGVRWQ